MTSWHMGALHPVEQLLTLLLAFGPFLVLGGVIWWRRRSLDRADSRAESRADSQADSQADR